MTNNRYAVGHEWSNHRGAVYVMQPSHPKARKDGFVARAKLVMEEIIRQGALGPGQSHEDYMLNAEPRLLLKEERVFHLDGDPSNDDPENLLLFPTQQTMSQWISARHREASDAKDRQTLVDFNRKVRELRERRQAAANKAHRAKTTTRAAQASASRTATRAANKRRGSAK